MSKVSLVIRALNEEARIGALLKGAASQTLRPHQIVLVDSGSTDGTVQIAERHGAVITHIPPEQFSFGRALNVGCAAAEGDILVFASAHVYPMNDTWLERLLAPFEDADIALTYGSQRGDDRTQFSEYQVMRKWFPERSDLDQQHPFCNNANCAVRRSVWEDMQYDEDLTGLEDLEWAARAMRRGFRIAYVHEAGVAHVHEETTSQTINRYRREALAHKRIFGDQSMTRSEAVGLFIAHCLRDYLAATAQRHLRGNIRSIPHFRAAQMLGTYRGFAEREELTETLKRRFYYPAGFDPDRWRIMSAPMRRTREKVSNRGVE